MATASLIFAALALPLAVGSSAGGHFCLLFLNSTASQAVWMTDGWVPFAAAAEDAATDFEMQFQPPDVHRQPQSADTDVPQPASQAANQLDAPNDSSSMYAPHSLSLPCHFPDSRATYSQSTQCHSLIAPFHIHFHTNHSHSHNIAQLQTRHS